jgi:RNAse (barnase) inhibitor barstar
MADKDVLLNTIQASLDLHTSKMDALEDTLLSKEAKRAADLVTKHTNWAYTRNRDRVIEIVTYHETNIQELNAMLRGDDDEDTS